MCGSVPFTVIQWDKHLPSRQLQPSSSKSFNKAITFLYEESEWGRITCLIRGNVRTNTEHLIGKSGWCSGYHDRLTRDRSRVQSPHPILFHSLSLFTSFLYHETHHTQHFASTSIPSGRITIHFFVFCPNTRSLLIMHRLLSHLMREMRERKNRR